MTINMFTYFTTDCQFANGLSRSKTLSSSE